MNFFKTGACALTFSFLAGSPVLAQWSTRYKAAPTSAITAITAVKFTDNTTGFAGGSNNLLLKTTDGGATWQQLTGAPAQTRTVDALSSNHIFIAQHALFVTEDGGGSWTEWGNWSSSGNYAIQAIKAINDSTAFVTKGSAILKTTNRGAAWTSVYSSADLYGGMQFTGNNDTAYAVSGTTRDGLSYGTLHKSTDGGNTWTDLALTSPQLTAWYFRTSREGYYTAFEGGLFKTADGGSTWQALTNPVAPGSDYVTGLLFSNSAVGYVATQNGLIYKTLDGGVTWVEAYRGNQTPTSFPQIALGVLATAGSRTVALGSESGFVETKGLILREDAPAGIPKTEQIAVRLYPNPVREKLAIEWDGKAQFGSLTLYDVLGKMVFSRNIAGQQSAVLEMSKFIPGNYFLELTGGPKPYRRQIVVQ